MRISTFGGLVLSCAASPTLLPLVCGPIHSPALGEQHAPTCVQCSVPPWWTRRRTHPPDRLAHQLAQHFSEAVLVTRGHSSESANFTCDSTDIGVTSLTACSLLQQLPSPHPVLQPLMLRHVTRMPTADEEGETRVYRDALLMVRRCVALTSIQSPTDQALRAPPDHCAASIHTDNRGPPARDGTCACRGSLPSHIILTHKPIGQRICRQCGAVRGWQMCQEMGSGPTSVERR
jgi:hypothetical protein